MPTESLAADRKAATMRYGAVESGGTVMLKSRRSETITVLVLFAVAMTAAAAVVMSSKSNTVIISFVTCQACYNYPITPFLCWKELVRARVRKSSYWSTT